MSQVIAPKDPEKQRPFFYIMRGKEIFGSPCFLYQSDGRLIDSATLVGNITDKEILKLLETTEGFKKLVHSIGVSVEAPLPGEEITFIFQMYGKKDPYNGGTNLELKLKGNGAEERIYLSEVEWSEDDNVPGQIRVIMETPEQAARLSVRFYLNDGYEAPEIIEENEVDLTSELYREMIDRSLVYKGNTGRLKKAFLKAKAGERVRVAYIGGSITQGAGATPINKNCYARLSYEALCDLLGEDNLNYCKAGVGGTPSELGMIRFDRDIPEEPDILIVEFAVNDDGDETKGVCYESLVRKALKLSSEPAVILMFSVFSNDYNLEERLLPVGKRYDIPCVSVRRAVVPQFYDNEIKVLSKNQYFYDMYHPSNLGHKIMADCLKNLFEIVDREELMEDKTGDLLVGEPAIGKNFEDVQLIDKVCNADKLKSISIGGFTELDTDLQCVELNMDLAGTPEFPNNWSYAGKDGQPLEIIVDCKAFLVIFKDTADINFTQAEIYVDGKKVKEADPFINGWTHCNPTIVVDEQDSREHIIQIIPRESEKKFTVLGFGIVE